MKIIKKKLVVIMLIMVFVFSLSPSEVQASVKNATSVKIRETSVTLSVGDAKILTASILPSSATNKTLSWSSSDTKIITVTKKGKVKAVAPGDATITVKTSNGKKASCEVTVVGYLDRMLYSSYTFDNIVNTYSLYEGNDYLGNKCIRGMKFYQYLSTDSYSEEVCKIGHTKSSVVYKVNSQFDVFTCTLTHESIEQDSCIRILGDGKVLYAATWTNKTQPVDLDLVIRGVNEFSIEIDSLIPRSGYYSINSILFSNARFEKE